MAKKRAIRRHHRARMIQRAIRMWREWGHEEDNLLYVARQSFNHMAVCSCHACGNQRRNPFSNSIERLTMPERKNLMKFIEEMEDV